MTLGERLTGRRVGVVLSSGYFGFFGHAGFVEGLREAGVAPVAWAGTSAGGLVAGLAAAQAPFPRVRDLLLGLEREHFWDPDYLGIAIDAVRQGHRTTGLLQGERFRALIEAALPVRTFEALAQPLVLVATNLGTSRPQVMRTGDLASAVHATCAYPGLFQAVRRDGQLLWDGGIIDKAPVLALAQAGLTPALDVLLVHYLPSRDGGHEPKGPFAYASGMATGFAALRANHFRLQLEVLSARGVEVHVVTSHLPPVSPSSLAEGARALEAGQAAARAALNQPPTPFSPVD